MSFSRSFLKSNGLNDDQITSIMEEHTAVTDELKRQRDAFKADADKLPGVQQELDTLKNGEDYKAKYESEHQAFEDYKAQVAKDAETAKVKAAYKKLLADEKINEKSIDDLTNIADLGKLKLDKDGNLENLQALKESINEKYGFLKVKKETRFAKPETPPKTDNGGTDNSIRQMTAKWHEAKYGKVPTSQGKE
jgi:archaellum component FlaC